MDSASSRLHMERDRPKKAAFIKVRFVIAVLATLCPVVCYISRQNLPFAIVSMVEEAGEQRPAGQLANSTLPMEAHNERGRTSSANNGSHSSAISNGRAKMDGLAAVAAAVANSADTGDNNKCPEPASLGQESGAGTTRGFGPKYEWSTDDKGILLGAFFYSYVLFQIPGARLAERIGAKWILVAATLGSALFSFVSPWAAAVHVHLLSLIRLLMGVCQAALYPTCYVLYAKWLPPAERSQALPILCVGAYVGSIVASSLTGYFSEQASLGWEYSFYLPGVLCALWTLAWILLAANEPRDHPTISIEELLYIESKLEVQRQSVGAESADATIRRPEISWRKLFASRSIWAMMVAFFASNWSFTIVLLLIPTYLSKILHVTPLNSGIINSIIYVLYCISSPLVGTGSTMMVETRTCGLSRLNIRKLFQGVALFGQAICFVILPLLGCEQRYVFGLLFVQIVFFSFANGGEVQLPTELSVDFAGTIYAIGNCVGSSTGFIVPYVFSQIVREEASREQWEAYFYLAAAISALGGLIFIIIGANHLQDFSKDLGESRLNICKLTGVLEKSSSSFNMDQTTETRRQPDRRGPASDSVQAI